MGITNIMTYDGESIHDGTRGNNLQHDHKKKQYISSFYNGFVCICCVDVVCVSVRANILNKFKLF